MREVAQTNHWDGSQRSVSANAAKIYNACEGVLFANHASAACMSRGLVGCAAQELAEVFAWGRRPGLFAFGYGTTRCLGLFVIALEIQLQKGLHGFTLECYFDAIQ